MVLIIRSSLTNTSTCCTAPLTENMMLLLFLFGLTVGAVSPSDEHVVMLQRGNCSLSWFSFNGRCYKYVSTPMTWADAELYCVSQRANLVSIHSLEEQNFVKTLIKTFDTAEKQTWIGLSDIHKEGTWMWSDGCTVNFVLWNPGEPNNVGENEHCTHNYLGTDVKWNDINCSHTFNFVCASRTVCP
ncbi:lactose-binding lectin l-2-like [Lates calcarifer]|uniref:Lactose-binding lectin l-2 n=1 Tax=Lates calcarifer TaxID=8187 RepID=A0AAJ7LHG0_LATCA|nr:lactose-binding lectin l-2 [Lates calcarifer]XP_018559189.1 lactose-binding lectin l-2-like [Lates calcarifer]